MFKWFSDLVAPSNSVAAKKEKEKHTYYVALAATQREIASLINKARNSSIGDQIIENILKQNYDNPLHLSSILIDPTLDESKRRGFLIQCIKADAKGLYDIKFEYCPSIATLVNKDIIALAPTMDMKLLLLKLLPQEEGSKIFADMLSGIMICCLDNYSNDRIKGDFMQYIRQLKDSTTLNKYTQWYMITLLSVCVFNKQVVKTEGSQRKVHDNSNIEMLLSNREKKQEHTLLVKELQQERSKAYANSRLRYTPSGCEGYRTTNKICSRFGLDTAYYRADLVMYYKMCDAIMNEAAHWFKTIDQDFIEGFKALPMEYELFKQIPGGNKNVTHADLYTLQRLLKSILRNRLEEGKRVDMNDLKEILTFMKNNKNRRIIADEIYNNYDFLAQVGLAKEVIAQIFKLDPEYKEMRFWKAIDGKSCHLSRSILRGDFSKYRNTFIDINMFGLLTKEKLEKIIDYSDYFVRHNILKQSDIDTVISKNRNLIFSSVPIMKKLQSLRGKKHEDELQELMSQINTKNINDFNMSKEVALLLSKEGYSAFVLKYYKE